MWQRFVQAAAGLFALHENMQCPLFFSLASNDAPLGVDALAHEWLDVLLYAFPPLSLIGLTLWRVRECGHVMILIARIGWRDYAWQSYPTVRRPALAITGAQGWTLTSSGGNIPPLSSETSFLGLAHERMNPNAAGLPSKVIDTIENAKAALTCPLYNHKCVVFE